MTQSVAELVKRRNTLSIVYMKGLVKYSAEVLRGLKQCRKTKNPPSPKFMEAHDCASPVMAAALVRLDSRLHTAKMLVYGQLRSKPHSVKDPQWWSREERDIWEELARLSTDELEELCDAML